MLLCRDGGLGGVGEGELNARDVSLCRPDFIAWAGCAPWHTGGLVARIRVVWGGTAVDGSWAAERGAWWVRLGRPQRSLSFCSHSGYILYFFLRRFSCEMCR